MSTDHTAAPLPGEQRPGAGEPQPTEGEAHAMSGEAQAAAAEQAGPQPAQSTTGEQRPAAPEQAAQPATRSPRPRTGPIVWGAIFLAFCAYVAQRWIAPGSIDAVTWVITATIGLGALLLVVGLAVIVRGSRR